VQVAFEGVDVVELEEGEAFGGEDYAVLAEGTADEIVGCVAGYWDGEGVG
jgi:hypothetical protein